MVAPADGNQNEVFTRSALHESAMTRARKQARDWGKLLCRRLIAPPRRHGLGEFQGLGKTPRSRLRGPVIEDGHQFAATLAFCHQLPTFPSRGIAIQSELDQRRKLAFCLHGLHDALANLIRAALATLAA